MAAKAKLHFAEIYNSKEWWEAGAPLSDTSAENSLFQNVTMNSPEYGLQLASLEC